MSNDWKEHDGEGCPVKAHTLVRYLRRDGTESPVRLANILDWAHIGHPGDIMFYRKALP
jgi:hypothetical protein